MPIVAWLIYLGGLPYLALIAVLATLAEMEFCRLIDHHTLRSVCIFGLALVWLFLLDSRFPAWHVLDWGLAGVLVISLGWQVLRYRQTTVRAWSGAIASGLYVGLCSSCLVKLRALPRDGLWWTLIIVPVTLFADSAAYVAGSLWGKHRLAPLLSFGKTWEGYVVGVLSGASMGAFLGWAWALRAGPGSTVRWPHSLILGLLLAALAPIGDLAISIVKREAGVKDSGKLLPGHGGVLDRMDSVLFAAVIGHAYVTWFLK